MTGPINDDHARHHNIDPDTSLEAAARLTTGQSDQVAILSAHCRRLQNLGEGYIGLADYESGDLAGIDHWNARKRCHELREAGLLRFNGGRRLNPDSNRANAVSALTSLGAQTYLQAYGIAAGGPLTDLIRREAEKFNDDGQGELF